MTDSEKKVKFILEHNKFVVLDNTLQAVDDIEMIIVTEGMFEVYFKSSFSNHRNLDLNKFIEDNSPNGEIDVYL